MKTLIVVFFGDVKRSGNTLIFDEPMRTIAIVGIVLSFFLWCFVVSRLHGREHYIEFFCFLNLLSSADFTSQKHYIVVFYLDFFVFFWVFSVTTVRFDGAYC